MWGRNSCPGPAEAGKSLRGWRWDAHSGLVHCAPRRITREYAAKMRPLLRGADKPVDGVGLISLPGQCGKHVFDG